MNTEEAAIQIANLIEQKSQFQETVGEIVLSVRDTYGTHQTDALQELVKEQGVTISSNSLRQYAWVTKNSKKLGLPSDLDFSTRRRIMRSPHKKKYLKLIEQGYTSAQIKREMVLDDKKKKHKGFCEDCKAKVDVKNHACKKK